MGTIGREGSGGWEEDKLVLSVYVGPIAKAFAIGRKSAVKTARRKREGNIYSKPSLTHN
jgi:hypothetical protein